MEATALARADMRAKTPSAKVAAKAVRSLKKKIARVREWEAMRERGKDLSADQVSSTGDFAVMIVAYGKCATMHFSSANEKIVDTFYSEAALLWFS